jgi:hypothetical protein
VETNSFDIIKVLTDDNLAWVEAAEELSAARVRVWQLLVDSPGEYIVFNQLTKTLVAHFSVHEAPQIPEWWREDDEIVEQPQRAVGAAAAQKLSLEDFEDDDTEEFVPVLQPAAA